MSRKRGTRLAIGAATVVLIAGCGSNTTGSTDAPSPNIFHAEVTDPVGDVVATAGVPHPPDLTRGTVDVSSGIITFTLQFASGTMDRQAINIVINLDTDQNPSTGQPALSGGGSDYQVGRTAGTLLGFVARYSPTSCASGGSCFMNVGQIPFSFGTDTFTLSVPLPMLGNASGRTNYQVFAYVADVLPGGGLTSVGDAMPDNGLPLAHVP
jgi:hypothetical protein